VFLLGLIYDCNQTIDRQSVFIIGPVQI